MPLAALPPTSSRPREHAMLLRSVRRASELKPSLSGRLQRFSSRRTGVLQHPSYASLAEDCLALPHFKTRAENVQVLNQPSAFYQTLIVSRSPL